MTEENKPVISGQIRKKVAAKQNPAAAPELKVADPPKQKVYDLTELLAFERDFERKKREKAEAEAEYVKKAVAQMKSTNL